MLSTSIGRVVRASNGAFTTVSRHATPPVGASSNAVIASACRRAHQRRYSSSKPPVPPNDGSRPIDASSQAPAKSVNPTNEKNEGKNAKRRGKDQRRHGAAKSDNQYPGITNLPSVPSTQHLLAEDVQIATFFSIHRPISVTTATIVPPPTTTDAFDAIFSGKRRKDAVAFTLSSAVKSMENTIHQHQALAHGGQDDPRYAMSQAAAGNAESNIIHLDNISAEDLEASAREYMRRFRPFNPPPPPTPLIDLEESSSSSPETTQQSEDQSEASPRVLSTVLTIRESTDSNGQKTYEAHVSPLVRNEEMEAPGAFGDMEITTPESPQGSNRSTMIERRRNDRTMHAISVRRQRKLKMKKHKYKKLLRKTRTLRRKLEKS